MGPTRHGQIPSWTQFHLRFLGCSLVDCSEILFTGCAIIVATRYHARHSDNYLTLLKDEPLPWACKHFGNRIWTYRQDGAPAHKSKKVQEFCQNNFPDFISHSEWPPGSPDLNPMDFSVWSVLEAKACSKRHKNIESLKKSLLKAWEELDPAYLIAAVDAIPKRRRACSNANGGRF